jgi:enterochelin esterase family protein
MAHPDPPAPFIHGDGVTFEWHGDAPPVLVGDFTWWGRGRPPIRLAPAGPDAWRATLRLPLDAYLEYAFERDGQRLPDPLNPRQIEDGLGHSNHYFTMPAWADTPLARPAPGGLRGTLAEASLPTLGHLPDEKRQVFFYQPPPAASCPLLMVLDGQDYVERAGLVTIVDNLIAEGQIGPLALALVAHGGPARAVEYACSDANLAFLRYGVLPAALERLRLIDPAAQPGAAGIMGASMGGLMALYAALRAPEVFGRVLCQSGAFGADDPIYRLYHRSVIEDLVAAGPPAPPPAIWQDCGLQEWFIAPNRRLAAVLQARGFAVTYTEHTSGHNFRAWRNLAARGLRHLYGEER